MDKAFSSAEPFRVGFLLVDGFALMSYSAALEPMRAANLLAGRTLYEMEHLPVLGAQSISSSGAVVRATTHIGERVDFDLIIVVAGGDPARFSDERVFQWLRHLARRGVQIGGVSGGPVILAKAGIMTGRRMTVHWEHAPALDQFEPALVLERTLYVIDRNRMTCAGGTAALDMMHALITVHHGAEFARSVSDWFMHTDIRPAGRPQRAGLVERYGTTSLPVIQAIELMENHIADPLALEQLAQLTGLGARQLNRLFHDKLGRSTMKFYRNLRLDKADNLLTQSTLSVTEIALASGFSSSAHFSQSYRQRFDRSPTARRLQPRPT